MIRCVPLPAGFGVRCLGDAPPLAPALAAEVDRVWDAELRSRSLFDGRVVAVRPLWQDGASAFVVPYRRVLAGIRRPDLRAGLGLWPLGVSGVLRCSDGIVVGQRADSATQDPGCWELVPSGGVEDRFVDPDGRVDLAGALLLELAEEVGLGADSASVDPPVLGVEDTRDGVVDIVLPLRVGMGLSQVRAAWRSRASREYNDLGVLPPPPGVDPHAHRTWSATTRAMLAALETAPR